MDTTRDFTSGPIVGPLIRFSLPILAALFLQALYGAVDLLVVGKYAATADVSGVAVGSQIMMTVTGLISSLAMGSTILLGQKLGMRAEKDCGRVIGTAEELAAAAKKSGQEPDTLCADCRKKMIALAFRHTYGEIHR
jgi:Na+-driven multidrug efflux pump